MIWTSVKTEDPFDIFFSFSSYQRDVYRSLNERKRCRMLSEDAFEVWCQRLGFLEQTKALISQIRSSPPSRLVRSATGRLMSHKRELKDSVG
jgi:hypothetical protein